MTKRILWSLAWLVMITTAPAELLLAKNKHTRYVVVVSPEASETERYAANDLARTLNEITGATFPVEETANNLPKLAIVVGQGSAAREVAPTLPYEKLGLEEIVILTKGDRLLLTGGRPRGTLYAVSRFLQDECGVRWWTPWASTIPEKKLLTIGKLDVRSKPAFEARDPFWFCAFDREWAVRNFSNSQSARIPESMGGCIQYQGFVHTFYPLVPPEKHFAEHPEWYSLIKGQRTTNHAQLCLTNPKLKDFVVERVKQWLKEAPEARIISVSQNDWHNPCECADCKALDDAEGSHAGTLLTFVNYVAAKIEAEFPLVAVDTLAYQYTRKPPKTVKPRSNVIVRLCSIEGNFREGLDHPTNAAFADDIKGWAQVCNRLYIWDYTTDFSHYLQPHPNYYTLGKNLRFFQKNNVRGVFEQGAYQAYGAEMAELRAWLLAQLMWNPQRDEQALIKQFLEGYYGVEAAVFIRRYLDLMHIAAKDFKLTCFTKNDAPFLQFPYLREAEDLWRSAEKAARNARQLPPVKTSPAARENINQIAAAKQLLDSAFKPQHTTQQDRHQEETPGTQQLQRVIAGHTALGYTWLSRWDTLRKECESQGGAWPLPATRKEFARQWLEQTKGIANVPWTEVKLINEQGTTPAEFVKKFITE